MTLCENCQFKILENMNYCPNCGAQIGGIKSKVSGMKSKLRFQIKTKVDNIRSDLDNRISEYLQKIDNDAQFKIGGKNIPENRKETIRNALLSFQNKISNDPNASAEFDQWLGELQFRLEEENCVICFQKWIEINDEVLICKYCQSGGHKEHLISWVRNNRFCPLCRESIEIKDLLKIDTKNTN